MNDTTSFIDQTTGDWVTNETVGGLIDNGVGEG